MFALLLSLVWACPKDAVCSTLEIESKQGKEFLSVQHWKSKKRGDNPPIYFIAGGPGQSATQLAPLLMQLPFRVHKDMDFWFLSPFGTQEGGFSCSFTGSALKQALDTKPNIKSCLPKASFFPEDYGSKAAAQHIETLRARNIHDKIILYGSTKKSLSKPFPNQRL